MQAKSGARHGVPDGLISTSLFQPGKDKPGRYPGTRGRAAAPDQSRVNDVQAAAGARRPSRTTSGSPSWYPSMKTALQSSQTHAGSRVTPSMLSGGSLPTRISSGADSFLMLPL